METLNLSSPPKTSSELPGTLPQVWRSRGPRHSAGSAAEPIGDPWVPALATLPRRWPITGAASSQFFPVLPVLIFKMDLARPPPPRPPAPTGSARRGPAMIKAILIFNNHGKPRLSKFYQPYSEDTQQQIIRETFHLVSKRDENVCNFLEGGLLIGGSDNKLIYRHYATLYFVFCVDSSESELGILDLIQVFVETLDKCFENVCELDLIFHVDKVHNILAEMVMGGMVLETNMNEIVTQIDAQNKLEKSEAGLAGAPARAVSAVKNMNLPEIPRNINIGDISIKVPNLPSFK